ncbi:hypothetical protein TGUWTKB_0470 [Candidatus Tachikawaea gelatinosa]|uniref:Uncharacterized protein n=1 Tax=Candidatus Tachikawaea gelatinosa TaxID=1410383 RepID=A0A090APV4_9ENTR|nr:hypothetical protein TGUWTKB_0470 [Candidatus Tachikawaea gelatinosa]
MKIQGSYYLYSENCLLKLSFITMIILTFFKKILINKF